MLHVCYDKDFVNMQISFLGLIQNFSKNYLKKSSCFTFDNTAHLQKSYLNTSQNNTNLASFFLREMSKMFRCFVPVNSNGVH